MRSLIPFFALIFATAAHADDIRQVAIPSRDMVYDPVSKRLYVSVPGSGGTRANSITWIDPVAGVAGDSVFIGSEPGRLALSDRSKYLWVALDGSNSVRKFDLATKTPGSPFTLGPNIYAEDLIMGNVALRCCENGLVYTDNGRVVDPETRSVIGEFPGYGYGSQLVVDAVAGRAYFLADRAFKIFDTHATGVFLTDDLTKDLDVVDVKASQGSATAAEGVLRADLSNLAPGASATVTVRVQPQKEGAFTPTAIVRCNEVDLVASNNAASQRTQLAAAPAQPSSGIDLTGAWISAGQTIHGAGVGLQATLEGVFVVRNDGTAPAPATKLRFLLSYTFGPFLEEDLLQEMDVPPLGPGKTFEARLRANLAKGDSAVGDVLTAVVDATKLVAESNKENNTVRSKPIP